MAPAAALSGSRGAAGWAGSGCRPQKKLRHESLAELGIAEAKQHGEVSFYWIPGKASPAGIFTKEGNDAQHYCSLRDLMAMAREKFIDDSSGSKAEAHAEEPKELADEEASTGGSTSLPNDAACRQPCIRWAGIAKKGRSQRPAPPAMGGAKRHSWLEPLAQPWVL